VNDPPSGMSMSSSGTGDRSMSRSISGNMGGLGVVVVVEVVGGIVVMIVVVVGGVVVVLVVVVGGFVVVLVVVV